MIERKEKEEGVFISPIAYYMGDKKRFRSRMGAAPSIVGHICSYMRESECSVPPPPDTDTDTDTFHSVYP